MVVYARVLHRNGDRVDHPGQVSFLEIIWLFRNCFDIDSQ